MANKMRNAAKERFWRDVLKRFAASGLSVRMFCRNEKLAESASYAWRRMIGERDAKAERPVKARQAASCEPQRPPQPPAFLPLLVSGNGHAHGEEIVLELAGGRVLRFPEAIAAERLAEIVVAIEAKGCAMIGPNVAGVQVWVATTPIDMRKSFDGPAEVVREFLKHDPLSGQLFVFRNKGGHLLKVLWWDTQGLAIYYKRLERGEFHWPRSNATAVEITSAQLLRLLSGLDIAVRRAS